MTSRSWKRSESDIAKRLGGRRNPVVGRSDVPDVETDWLAVEVKSRSTIPTWLKAALKQARAGAKRDQLALVVLHEKNHAHNDDLVLLRLRDFEAWFGGAPAGPQEAV